MFLTLFEQFSDDTWFLYINAFGENCINVESIFSKISAKFRNLFTLFQHDTDIALLTTSSTYEFSALRLAVYWLKIN